MTGQTRHLLTFQVIRTADVFYEFLTSRLLRTRGANNAAKKRQASSIHTILIFNSMVLS